MEHKSYDICMEPESNPTPAPQPAGQGTSSRLRGIFSNRLVLTVAALIILAVAAAGAYFLIKPKPTTTVQPGLQDVSADELKKFQNSFLKPTTGQTVTINPNAHFNNDVTVDKTLTAGAITTPFLNVQALSPDNINVKNNLTVGGATTLQGNVEARNQLTVRGGLSARSVSVAGDLAVAGNLTAGSISISTTTIRDATITNSLTVNGHVVSDGSSVTAQTGAAIGGGGSVTVKGNDVSGTVFINTGSGPIAGQLAIIRFAKTFTTAPRVILTPVGNTSGSLQWYVTRSASLFTIESGTAPTSTNQYIFDYFVVQ